MYVDSPKLENCAAAFEIGKLFAKCMLNHTSNHSPMNSRGEKHCQ